MIITLIMKNLRTLQSERKSLINFIKSRTKNIL